MHAYIANDEHRTGVVTKRQQIFTFFFGNISGFHKTYGGSCTHWISAEKAGQNGKLFGSVTSKEIAEKVKAEFGIETDKRKIIVDDIKQFGTYEFEIKLYQGISAKLYVMVGE